MTGLIASLDKAKAKMDEALEKAREAGLEIRDGVILKPEPPPGIDWRAS